MEYITSAPSPQNGLDIFKGEWWSRLPEPLATSKAGHLDIFEDPRISWALSQAGSIRDQTVLELGPLEGAHTYIFERAGAASIVAIEATPRAYLKCLIVKELLGLTRAHFLCGDFVEYLRGGPQAVDFACASGVLYHMVQPVELIALLSTVAPRLFLWTHYYDTGIASANRTLRRRFTRELENEHLGFRHRLFRYEYWGSFGVRRFCGGSRPYAHWMTRDDILACLKYFGFDSIQTSYENLEHPDGPSFAVLARRS
ncbi:MAG: class I SAM-dependent methyltransferase [Acidobacteriaceae bacterium]|nr:class I SAM-dependent methyltransferase [Acidobacteriaceae bacterium]